MSTDNRPTVDTRTDGAARPRRTSEGYALRVNAYDRASSVLVALLIMSVAVVAGLVIIYFTRSVVKAQKAIPVTPVSASPASEGIADDSSPGVENAPEELEPQLQETLNVMNGVIAAQLSLFDEESDDSEPTPGRGDGLGDSRAVGDGVGDGVEEPQREIRYEPESLTEYAAWFDAMGFELAVLGNDNLVYYASGVSEAKPKTRSGPSADEQRMYFLSSGPLAPLDRQLASKSGLLSRGSVILKFCSPETQQRLLSLEQDAAQGRTSAEIERTVYRVVRARGQYDFRVEEIKFRS